MHSEKNFNVPENPYGDDLESVLIDEETLHAVLRSWRRRPPIVSVTKRTTSS